MNGEDVTKPYWSEQSGSAKDERVVAWMPMEDLDAYMGDLLLGAEYRICGDETMVQGIKSKDIIRFENACNRLAKVMEDIQAYNPKAHIFCNMDFLELHAFQYNWDDEFHKAEPVASVFIKGTDCGER